MWGRCALPCRNRCHCSVMFMASAQVDEIFGTIQEVFFSVKPGEGVPATSFKAGDKLYINPEKLLPLARFLPGAASAGGGGKGKGKGKDSKGKGKGKGKDSKGMLFFFRHAL